MTNARELIKDNEGLRLKPYKCTAGKLTIGYGRNLEDKGISLPEAELLLDMDIEECERDLEKFPFWQVLNKTRQAVLIDMRFQLGLAGLKEFKRMLQAIEMGHFTQAAIELMDSRYARQTPGRAKRNATMVRTGKSL